MTVKNGNQFASSFVSSSLSLQLTMSIPLLRQRENRETSSYSWSASWRTFWVMSSLEWLRENSCWFECSHRFLRKNLSQKKMWGNSCLSFHPLPFILSSSLAQTEGERDLFMRWWKKKETEERRRTKKRKKKARQRKEVESLFEGGILNRKSDCYVDEDDEVCLDKHSKSDER